MKTKQCLQCGKEFKRNVKYSVKQWLNSKYCSVTCSKVGYKPSRESIEKMRKTLTGRKLTPEHVAKIRAKITGELNYNWKGGASKTTEGYIGLNYAGKRQLEHRKIMELYLGRKLELFEVVHHIDGCRTNNDISNLEVMTRSEHAKQHGNLNGHRPWERVFNDNKV